MENTSLKQINLGKGTSIRLDNIETQVDLHSSLLDSERGTRLRAHTALHERFDAQDKRLVRLEWMAAGLIGAIAAVNLLPVLIQIVKDMIVPK